MTVERHPSRSRLASIHAAALPLGFVLAAPPAALAAVVSAIRARPSLLAAATVFVLCVPPGPRPEQSSALAPADLTALVLVLMTITLAIVNRDLGVKRNMLLAFLGLTFAATLATWTATDVPLSAVGWVRQFEIFVAVPLAVALSLRSRADIVILLGAFVAVGLFQGAIGVHQFVTHTGAGFAGDNVRAIGTFGSYDIMTLPTVVSVALLAALAVAVAGLGRLSVVAGLCAALLLVPLAMSLSRGAWIAAAAAVLVVLACASWRTLIAVVCVGALLVTCGVVLANPNLSVVSERLDTVFAAEKQPDRSVRDRYGLWASATAMWRDHPVTGVGPKNYRLWLDTYAPLSLSSGSDASDSVSGFRRVELESPHNLYLLYLSEQGAVGILALGAFLLTLLVGTLRRLRSARVERVELVVCLLAIGLLTRFVVASISGDLGGSGSVLQGLTLGVVVWCAGGLQLQDEPKEHRILPTRSSRL
jgi:O-antigen ligase